MIHIIGGIFLSIKNFKYYWRFSDEKYAVLTEEELSLISVVSKDDAKKKWINICKEEIFQKSIYIKDIIQGSAPVLINDCFWGEDEDITKEKLLDFFDINGTDEIEIYYDCENGLSVPVNLFCERWSDFCYPSDLILIILPSIMIVYYEDIIYGPYII